MESQPKNPEFKIHPEKFHPCIHPLLGAHRVFHRLLKLYESLISNHGSHYGHVNWTVYSFLSKEEGNNQESIQSNTTPDPRQHMGK